MSARLTGRGTGTGTTAVLGPSDVVEQLLTQIGVDASTGKVPCDTKFEVSVVIAGQEFPIDPLDWLSIGDGSSRPMCTFYLGVSPTLTFLSYPFRS